jgi:CheY-like chemotaxis protein
MLDSQSRILIVEDQAIIAEDLLEILVDFGCSVVGVARHCDEALQILETVRIDLALLDVDFHGEKAGLPAAL